MSDLEKMNIYIPADVLNVLDTDARNFEILKKNRIDTNRNRFLSLLICGFYEQYSKGLRDHFNVVLNELQLSGINGIEAETAARNIVKLLYIPEIAKKRGKHSNSISLKPTKDTESIIADISNSPDTQDYISRYFARMFIDYSKLPATEREKIIFHDTYRVLKDAIAKKRNVSLSTVGNVGKRHIIVPYKIVSGQNQVSNYLIGQERGEDGTIGPCNFRLSRITNCIPSRDNDLLQEEVKEKLDRMERNGAEYVIRDNAEYIVRLTDEGMKMYRRINYGRPMYEKIVPGQGYSDYYFRCSENQLFLYFRRFGKDAEVLETKELRQRLAIFYAEGAETYRE